MRLKLLILAALATCLLAAATDDATKRHPRVAVPRDVEADRIPANIDAINSAASQALTIVTKLRVTNIFFLGPQLAMVLGDATEATTALLKASLSFDKTKPPTESQQRSIFEAFRDLVAVLLKLLEALLWLLGKVSGTVFDGVLLLALRPFLVAVLTLADAIAKFAPKFAKESAVLSAQLAKSVKMIVEMLDRARG